MTFDVTGMTELVADMTAAPARVQRESAVVVRVGGEKIAKSARQFASGLAHAPAYPRSITAEVKIVGGAFESLVGPDKDLPQGALGNILEYGTVKNAPIVHLGPALDLEGPNFEKAMEALGDL